MATKRTKSQPPSGKSPVAAPLGFAALVDAIRSVHKQCAMQAGKAVNMSLTVRNWLIGGHIHQYELHGTDRATYGDRLLANLADQLGAAKVSNCDRRQLYRYLRFYRLYPEIVGTLSPLSERNELDLLNRLSYSHIEQLLEFDDPFKRRFYEVETLRGNWSVRELKRQIATQYFERSGLSTDKDALARLAHAHTESQTTQQIIRDPYVFEFLGLKPKEVMSEGDLEGALLDKLQDFLLELGHGFCFEARQKRHAGRRPATHRHPAVHPQEPRNGGICAGGYEQHPVRLALPGATARQGRDSGLLASGGGRVRRRG